MAIRQSRGRWTVEFQQRGTRIFKRLPPGITKAQAQEYETNLRRGIFDGELGKKPDITLTDAIGRWLLENQRKNQRKARSEAKQWEPFVTGKTLRQAPEVAISAVAEWRSQLVGSNGSGRTPQTTCIAPATINRRLAMLKAVCKHAYKTGLIGENLSGRITLLTEKNQRDIYLTKPEAVTLAGKMPTPAYGAGLMLLSYSGLRVSELLAQEGLTERSKEFYVHQQVSKGRKARPRYVPIAPAARRYLASWLAQEQFPSYWQLHKEFLVARRKAKLPYPKLRIHDLRHTAASWLINAGADLYTVGKILGHAGPQTTARYAHLAKDTLERAMGRLK